MLRLVSTGPGGQILTELGQGPLRTKQLTERVREFSPRSVYRCVAKMQDHRLVDRCEEPGRLPKVVLRLTDPMGRNLYRLLRPSGAASWQEMCLLGELWEAGFVEELSLEPRSLMELLDGPHHLTYHQVKRRVGMSVENELLYVTSPRGNSRLYELTDRARRHMALLAGIGRWRHRHIVPEGEFGMEIGEMATLLRAALPLMRLPEYEGKSIALIVSGAEEYGQRETAAVSGAIGADGVARFDPDPAQPCDGSAAGTLNTWFTALLEGHRGRIRVRGDCDFVDSCLRELYDVLWETAKA